MDDGLISDMLQEGKGLWIPFYTIAQNTDLSILCKKKKKTMRRYFSPASKFYPV